MEPLGEARGLSFASDPTSMNENLFRAEAVAHRDDNQELGDVLRYAPIWPRIAASVLGAAVLAFFVFVSVVAVDDFASGPVVIRVEGRRLVTAATAAAVEAVAVNAGDWVEQGAEVVRTMDGDERNELLRAEKDFDNQLLRILRDPNDRTSKDNLSALRAKRDQAKNAVEARVIRAPVSGHVSDVRVRVGQPVNPGEVLLAITAPGEAKVSAVAMVPASFRPMLQRGSEMRFDLEGFKFDYTDVTVEEVSSEAVGSREMQRLLGQERSDAVNLDTGAHVLVTAKIPTSTFSSEGESYAFFDGLTGLAEIRVRREPILVVLIPALRGLVQ
jgi:membrane fusion protein (multidrug efflux system)